MTVRGDNQSRRSGNESYTNAKRQETKSIQKISKDKLMQHAQKMMAQTTSVKYADASENSCRFKAPSSRGAAW